MKVNFHFQKDDRQYQIILEQVSSTPQPQNNNVFSSEETESEEAAITLVDMSTLEKWRTNQLLAGYTFSGLSLLFEDGLHNQNNVSFLLVKNGDRMKITIKIQDRYKGQRLINFDLTLVIENQLENLKLVIHKQNLQIQELREQVKRLEQRSESGITHPPKRILASVMNTSFQSPYDNPNVRPSQKQEYVVVDPVFVSTCDFQPLPPRPGSQFQNFETSLFQETTQFVCTLSSLTISRSGEIWASFSVDGLQDSAFRITHNETVLKPARDWNENGYVHSFQRTVQVNDLLKIQYLTTSRTTFVEEKEPYCLYPSFKKASIKIEYC